MITLALIALIGTGGFIVSAISYSLGVFKIITNFPAVSDALLGFFGSFFR